MSDEAWVPTYEKVEPHGLCCRKCAESRRLLIDMAAWVADVRARALRDDEPDYNEMDALLARFAALEQKAEATP